MAAFKRRQRKRMFVILGILAAIFAGMVGVGVIGAVFADVPPESAGAGNCLSGKTPAELKVEKCSNPQATFKVLKTYDDVSESAGKAKCNAVPGATDYFYKARTMLCLRPIH